jgi:hypothetical protein
MRLSKSHAILSRCTLVTPIRHRQAARSIEKTISAVVAQSARALGGSGEAALRAPTVTFGPSVEKSQHGVRAVQPFLGPQRPEDRASETVGYLRGLEQQAEQVLEMPGRPSF